MSRAVQRRRDISRENIVALPAALISLIDHSRGDLMREEFIDLCVRSFIGAVTQPEEFVMEEAEEVSKSVQLPRGSSLIWALTIAIYGAADLLTSFLVLKLGLNPANPIFLLLGNLISLFFFKVSVIIGIFLVAYLFLTFKWVYYMMPAAVTIIGCFYTVVNIVKYVSVS